MEIINRFAFSWVTPNPNQITPEDILRLIEYRESLDYLISNSYDLRYGKALRLREESQRVVKFIRENNIWDSSNQHLTEG